MATVAKKRPSRKKSRSEQIREANRQQRLLEQRITIPKLTAAQRKKRERLERDSEAWIWEMCGPRSGILEPLKYKFTSQQAEMIGAYDQALEFGGDDLILASRGEGKTTYFRAALWKAVSTGLVGFVALIGATGDDATYSREAIQDMIVRSKPFRRLYPEIAAPAAKVGSAPQTAGNMRASGHRHDTGEAFEDAAIGFTWSQRGLWFPDVPGSPSARAMMQFRGADKPIRGLNILGRRPSVIGIDDLDTPDTVSGKIENAEKVIDRVNLDIGGLRDQSGKFARVMLATLPKQATGVAHHFATKGQPFVVRRFKYLIEKPQRWDLWMEYVKRRQQAKAAGDKYARAAHRFYLKHRRQMDAGHEVSNPHRFNPTKLPDGTKTQVSALQNYFDEWADKGEFFCRCELDNELIAPEEQIVSKLEPGHITECETDRPRGIVAESTELITAGIDVRKIELHHATLSSDAETFHRIPDYDARAHGSTETTVEMAEKLIETGLNRLADRWDAERLVDPNGAEYRRALTLVDKGWLGSWKEDGEYKSWATQPVETFCQARGLRRWLPAKGQPKYRSPAPGRGVVIGDNWHINKGKGQERTCSEVIWNAEHYHQLVIDLFLIGDERQRFELFHGRDGIHKDHRRLSAHIHEGAEELFEMKRRSGHTRKPKYRRDHFFDALAMALVAASVERHLREYEAKRQSSKRSLAAMAKAAGNG